MRRRTRQQQRRRIDRSLSLMPPAARAAMAAEAEDVEFVNASNENNGALVQVEDAQQAEAVLAERLTPVILALADDPLVVAAVAQSAAVQQFLHTESDLILGIGDNGAGAEMRLFDTSARAIAAGEFVEFAPEAAAADVNNAAEAAEQPADASPLLSPFHSFLEQRRDLLLKVVLPTAIAVIVARAVPSVVRARELVASVFQLAVGRWFHTAAAATAQMASEATAQAASA
jgi:hypothetical protein